MGLSFLTSGCALFSSSGPDRTYTYLTGKGLKNPSSMEVMDALTRDSSMSGGNYQIKAYPYTYTLIEAMVREAAEQRGLNPEQQKSLKENLTKKFLAQKTCFHFNYQVLRFNKSSQLKNWKLAILDKKDQEYPTDWNGDDLKVSAVKTKKVVAGDRLDQWLGEGTACTSATPALKSGFGIKVTPDFVQFPFDKSAKIYWEFPEIRIVDGEEEVVEDKKKSYRSYRGW